VIQAAIFVCISCGRAPRPQPSFDISVRNDTTVAFDNVKIQFGSHLAWREDPSISPSQTQTILWNAEPPTHETAEVHIVEHNGSQPHIIKLSVERLKTLPPGKHDVIFSVTALDQARVIVDNQPK
jgi:hypothetical protein